LLSAGAGAQVIGDRPTPLPPFGRSVVTNDDSTALVHNPANLALLPGADLRWQAAFLDERARSPHQGHAIALAVPVKELDFGMGVRVDLIDPPAGQPPAIFGSRSRYQWLTAGLSKGFGNGALGVSFQHAYSETNLIDSFDSWSLGYTVRPVNQLAFALVGHDINAPRSRGGGFLSRSYEIGVALRPVGSQALELGFEGKFIDTASPYWIPRATLGLDVPTLGRLRGEFSLSDPDDRAGHRAWLAAVARAG
jgi:protease-4